jgi:glycosyltransferase involved in cell wall biosynthesis
VDGRAVPSGLDTWKYQVRSVQRMTKPTLHWVCHSPSPYNDFMFQAMANCADFSLQVHYLFATSGQDHWILRSERGYSFRCFRRMPLDWTLVRTVLGDRKNVFLTACWQDPTCQLILLVLMFLQRPYLLWSDTPVPRNRGWIKSRLRRSFLRAVFRRALAVLGTGEVALKEFVRMGASQHNVLNLPYCIDVNTFVPNQNIDKSSALVLGTCARLHSSKGIDLALRTLARLARLSTVPFRYRIAGAGPEEQRLKALSVNLGLADQVEFCGWLQPEALPRFYQSLDVYLHPARFEAYGVAVIEALACGVPVLASDRTMAAIDRGIDGECGLLHITENEDDLLRTIGLFFNLDQTRRHNMALAARQASRSWTVEQAVDRIRGLVGRVTNGTDDLGSSAQWRYE